MIVAVSARITLAAVLSLGLAGAQEVFGPPPPPPPPSGARLAVEPLAVHLGEVYFGESIKGSVELVNNGVEDLVISEVKSTCGCTAAPLAESDKIIPPGGRVTLPITMKPKSSVSPLVKHLSIKSNDPTTEVFSVKVSCDVLTGVMTEPNYVLFRDATLGETVSQTVKIKSQDGETFRIESITFTADIYSASWDKEADILEHVVTVTVGPLVSRNNPSSQMLVKTTHSKTSEVKMNANTLVAPLVAKSASRLMYQPIKPGGSGVFNMQLWERKTGDPLDSLSITMPTNPEITFETARDDTDPKIWHITAHVPESEQRPVIGAAAQMLTNIDAEGKIPIMCVIRIDNS